MNDLFSALNTAHVRYLLVGGQAMRLYGMPRFSMDWDFFIPPRAEGNFKHLNEILKEELGTPQTRWGILQFHPGLPGVPRFDGAEKSLAVRHSKNGMPVKCLSGIHLLVAKRAAARPQDQADIIFLEELKRIGKPS